MMVGNKFRTSIFGGQKIMKKFMDLTKLKIALTIANFLIVTGAMVLGNIAYYSAKIYLLFH